MPISRLRPLSVRHIWGLSPSLLFGCQDGSMSYDLAVWVGQRPASAATADAEYAQRMDAMEVTFEQGGEPSVAPEIAAFVEAATNGYPDEDPSVDSPWASSPLIGEAVGDLIYFPLTFSGAEYARDVLAEIAASLGLVCYDPQIEALLPDVDATPASDQRESLGSASGTCRPERRGITQRGLVSSSLQPKALTRTRHSAATFSCRRSPTAAGS